MEREEILAQVQEIFRDLLDKEEVVVVDETNAEDIEEWDSLFHIQLIDAIQKQFNIKFTAKEMLSWDNVGELIECIKGKI